MYIEMERIPMDSDEFSTSVDELLKDDNDTEQSTIPVIRPVCDENIDSDLLCKNDKNWMREWCLDLKRDDISSMLIIAVCFTILTNPIFLNILQPYLPIFIQNNSIGYNTWGSYIFGAIFSLMYAFLVLK